MFATGTIIARFRGAFGVPVEIASSFLMFFAVFFVGIGIFSGDPVGAAIICGSIALSIYLHELGHAFAARAQGVGVRGVLLYGGGGLCAHDPCPPKQTLIITLGGPLVNLVLWYVATEASAGLVARAAGVGMGEADRLIAWSLWVFGYINLLLLIFNLLPVLPLDGGRILFHVLWYWLPRDRAMRVTGLFGLIISVVWIPAAIYLFVVGGFLIFFFPSIRENLQRFRGERDF